MGRVSKDLRTTGMEDTIAVVSAFIADGIDSAAQILGGNVEAARRIVRKAGFTDKILKYKRHVGSVKYFAEDKLYYGSVLGVRTPIVYEGNTEELLEDRSDVNEKTEVTAVAPAEEENLDEEIGLAAQNLPSSMGVTFLSSENLNSLVCKVYFLV